MMREIIDFNIDFIYCNSDERIEVFAGVFYIGHMNWVKKDDGSFDWYFDINFLGDIESGHQSFDMFDHQVLRIKRGILKRLKLLVKERIQFNVIPVISGETLEYVESRGGSNDYDV